MSILPILVWLAFNPPSQFDKDLRCMIDTVYYEAGVDTIDSKKGVALVVLNRLKRDDRPPTGCGVVYESEQFSWVKLHNPNPDYDITTTANYRQSLIIAIDYMNNSHFDITMGAIMYHAEYVRPDWADDYIFTVKLGKHLFYTDALGPTQVLDY